MVRPWRRQSKFSHCKGVIDMPVNIPYSPPPANATERLWKNRPVWTPTKEARDKARALVSRTMMRISREESK
jgi:hypothetical protein